MGVLNCNEWNLAMHYPGNKKLEEPSHVEALEYSIHPFLSHRVIGTQLKFFNDRQLSLPVSMLAQKDMVLF
jgi:hypothetical protein